jgi:hypothetical protein
MAAPFPSKPKSMWWRTYDRLRKHAFDAEIRADEVIGLRAPRFLARRSTTPIAEGDSGGERDQTRPAGLGARIGITSVLHTWGSALTHHPHVHMIVPGGGISLDGTRWVPCRPDFILPVEVLSCLFRGFARWEPDYERVKALRDALSDELRSVYPAVVAQLADLFQRMEVCDRECSRINGSAPDREHRRLLGVELTARGVDRLWQPDVIISKELRLPYLTRDKGPIYAWPRPTPPLFAASFMVPSGPGPNWHEEIEARNAARREESDRAIAYLNERAREHEERELKEGKEAIAREIAERNRRAGWG